MAPGCFARGRHTHAHTCPLYSRFREDFEGVFCFGVTGFCSPKGREEKPSGREEGKGKEGGRCGYCIWYESIAIRKDFGDSFSDDSDWHRPREDALDTRKRRESVDRCDCRSSLQRYRGNLESNTEGGIGIRLDQLVDTHNLFLVAGEGGKKRRNTPTFCPPSPPPLPHFPPFCSFLTTSPNPKTTYSRRPYNPPTTTIFYIPQQPVASNSAPPTSLPRHPPSIARKVYP